MKIDNVNNIKTKGRKKKIVYALDWDAQDYKDRFSCVEKLEKEGALNYLSPSQLNEVANYLLYSRDVDCEVELKKSSKRSVSYEDLVDSGVADMAINNAKYKNIYKVYRPSIDREKDADIPGMKDLWVEIDKVKKIYDYLDDCLKGRREKDFNNPLEINYVNHHYYKNWYIELCLQQYTLKDCYKPVMSFPIKEYFDLGHDNNYEFGIKVGQYVLNESDEDKMIDLANPLHIYLLLKSYKAIKTQQYDETIDDWGILYNLVDRAIERVKLSDCLWEILELKVNGEQNDVIGPYIRNKYKLNYNDNYISTLFTKTISRKIAKAAMSNILRDKLVTKKRVCPRCKKERWEDEFFSTAKSCGYCLRKLKEEKKKIIIKE